MPSWLIAIFNLVSPLGRSLKLKMDLLETEFLAVIFVVLVIKYK